MADKMTKEDIAKLAKPFDQITAADFTVLRAKKDTKIKGEAKKPMNFMDTKKPRKHHG